MSSTKQQSLEISGFFPALFARSVPSNESIDGYLGTVESFGNSSEMANLLFPCVEEIRSGALRVSQSFGLFEPLIRKILRIPGIMKICDAYISPQSHSITLLLCDLMGAESLETRQCVMRALSDTLDGFRLDYSVPEWLVRETTPFSVNSDGTLKEETLLGKLSILLTESMNAIDTLLDDVCDDNVKTLSNHCRLVASAFSCLALLGKRKEEPKEILKSKGVLQQIGAWAGSLLNTPPSPTRNEALLSLVQILVDIQSYSPPAELISLDLVFPDSSTPLADLLTLIEPLIAVNSDKAKTVLAQFWSPCSECCKPGSGDKSLLFTFFNKFVHSAGFIEVDLENTRFHESIRSFLSAHLFTDDSSDPNPIDTPSLRAYFRQLFLSHSRTTSQLLGRMSLFVECIPGVICQNVTSLLFWKDVGGVAAIVNDLTLENRFDSRSDLFTAIHRKILFPEGSVPTPEQLTLIIRELEEEGFSDAVELDADFLHRLPEWNVAKTSDHCRLRRSRMSFMM
ncbi:hypothetical protein BLNAU_7759 [Blattamonas nauphoetae]|uniref:MMS19 nucleotide excision repair protein n=1 Tax=Blattamonas nauphoetae TaxID=2049346 RepID=A0ABQ9Y0W3_9EUKA|nr:hypothetical protein BLNAU_7759 [Blattamonas nauphoetae]